MPDVISITLEEFLSQRFVDRMLEGAEEQVKALRDAYKVGAGRFYLQNSERPHIANSGNRYLRVEALRRMAWRVSDVPRVRRCGRYPLGGAVNIVGDRDGARFCNLEQCGSVWACASCAQRRRGEMAARLSAGVGRWLADGRGASLVTLTLQHGLGDRLDDLFDQVQSAWNAIIVSRAWKSLKVRGKVVDFVKGLEVTYGENGWHPHLHVLVTSQTPLDDASLQELSLACSSSWATRLGRFNRGFEVWCGIDVERCYSGEAVAYGLKVAGLERSAVGNEVLRSDRKQALGEGLAPFELLELACESPYRGGRYLMAWREFETATAGRRSVTFSRTARQNLGLVDEDDERQADELGDVLATILARDWHAAVVSHPLGHCVVLDAAVRAGAAGVWLAIKWLYDDLAGEATRPHWYDQEPAPPLQLSLL